MIKARLIMGSVWSAMILYVLFIVAALVFTVFAFFKLSDYITEHGLKGVTEQLWNGSKPDTIKNR